MLVAGLAGLDKIGEGALDQYDGRLGVDITAESRWTRMIDQAAAVNNRALVAMLAGLAAPAAPVARWPQCPQATSIPYCRKLLRTFLV